MWRIGSSNQTKLCDAYAQRSTYGELSTQLTLYYFLFMNWMIHFP